MSSDRYNEEMLLGFLEGDLSPEQTLEFEKLLVEDAQLRNLVAQMVLDRHRLRKLPDEQAPAEVMERVNQVLERRMLIGGSTSAGDSTPRMRQRSIRWLTMGGMAAGVALMVGWFAWTLTDKSLNDMSKTKRPEALGPMATSDIKGKQLASAAQADRANRKLDRSITKDGWAGREKTEDSLERARGTTESAAGPAKPANAKDSVTRAITESGGKPGGAPAPVAASKISSGDKAVDAKPAESNSEAKAKEADADVKSLWTTDNRDWRGNLVWGDNHAEYYSSHRDLATRYSTATSSQDSLFTGGQPAPSTVPYRDNGAPTAAPAPLTDADALLRLADGRAAIRGGGGEAIGSNAVGGMGRSDKPTASQREQEWRYNSNGAAVFSPDSAPIEVTSVSLDLTQRRLTDWAMSNNFRVTVDSPLPVSNAGAGYTTGQVGGSPQANLAAEVQASDRETNAARKEANQPANVAGNERVAQASRNQRQLVVALPRRQVGDLVKHLNEQSGQRAQVAVRRNDDYATAAAPAPAAAPASSSTSGAAPGAGGGSGGGGGIKGYGGGGESASLSGASRMTDAVKKDTNTLGELDSSSPRPEHMLRQSPGGALGLHGPMAFQKEKSAAAGPPATQPITGTATVPAPAATVAAGMAAPATPGAPAAPIDLDASKAADDLDAIVEQRVLIIEDAKR